jgi:hypothetical protein
LLNVKQNKHFRSKVWLLTSFGMPLASGEAEPKMPAGEATPLPLSSEEV